MSTKAAQLSAGMDAGAGKDEVWPLWKLALIALPQLGVQVLWGFIGPQSAPYMLSLGMGPALATLNNVAGPITGFFTGPIVGATSDNCTSRFGRRRPIILAGLLSTWVAGMLFASANQLVGKNYALYLAAPLYWVMDVTINVMQTPHRALVSDLASEEQQVPTQVIFVFIMAIGNFLAFRTMRIYDVPVENMSKLMFGICLLNTLCVGIQFMVAREKPLTRRVGQAGRAARGPISETIGAVRSSSSLLLHLAAVQCLVWIGNTAWNNYGGQWFTNSVYQGDQKAPKGSPAKIAYSEGNAAFSLAGQFKSGLQLVSTLLIIALLLKTKIRPRLLYAPCIFTGGVAALLAGLAVGHDRTFAMACMTLSIMPETGSFSIPFGLLALLSKRAQEEGQPVSTALQMALLNCCVTVGQQVCTLTLAGILTRLPLARALPCIFLLAAGAQALAGLLALCLDDRPAEDESDSESGSSSSTSKEDDSNDEGR